MTERASEEIVVRAPADVVMEIITDLEAYPDWAEAVEEVEVRETDDEGRGTIAWFHVDAKVMEVEYVLRYSYGDDKVEWTLVESDQFRGLDGSYTLIPEGDGTRVRYDLTLDLKLSLPGFLKKRAQKQIIDTSLGELKRRAEANA